MSKDELIDCCISGQKDPDELIDCCISGQKDPKKAIDFPGLAAEENSLAGCVGRIRRKRSIFRGWSPRKTLY